MVQSTAMRQTAQAEATALWGRFEELREHLFRQYEDVEYDAERRSLAGGARSGGFRLAGRSPGPASRAAKGERHRPRADPRPDRHRSRGLVRRQDRARLLRASRRREGRRDHQAALAGLAGRGDRRRNRRGIGLARPGPQARPVQRAGRRARSRPHCPRLGPDAVRGAHRPAGQRCRSPGSPGRARHPGAAGLLSSRRDRLRGSHRAGGPVQPPRAAHGRRASRAPRAPARSSPRR